MTAKEAKKLSLKRASIQSRVDEVLINVKTATTYGYFSCIVNNFYDCQEVWEELSRLGYFLTVNSNSLITVNWGETE